MPESISKSMSEGPKLIQERPKIGVGVIIKRERKILLGLRINSHGENTWSTPGGHLEFGETPEETALREVKEESGLIVVNPALVKVTNDIFIKEGKHYITLFVEVDYNGGEAVLNEPEKCKGWECFSWDTLPQPLFLPIVNLIKTDYQPIFTKFL